MKQKKNRSNYWKKNCSGKTIQCPQHDTRGSRSHFFRLKFESSPHAQTSATIIDPTVIYPCFYLRNDHTDSCYCRNWKVTPGPGPVFLKFLTPAAKEKRRILPDSTPVLPIRSHLCMTLPKQITHHSVLPQAYLQKSLDSQKKIL